MPPHERQSLLQRSGGGDAGDGGALGGDCGGVPGGGVDGGKGSDGGGSPGAGDGFGAEAVAGARETNVHDRHTRQKPW